MTEERWEIERDDDFRPSFPLLGEMFVEPGTKADWELLHELHYKTEGSPVGAHYWRCVLAGETIGVVVFSIPRPLIKERNLAFPSIKPGGDETKLSNTLRYQFINANYRVVSRMVVDTMFRGVGVAYRMLNLASRMEGRKFAEIQSSMSKYNFFAQRAGFRFIKPMRSAKYEDGIKFFKRHFTAHYADHEAVIAEIEAMPPFLRDRVVKEMREFYFRHSSLEKTGNARKHGTSKVDEMPVPKLLKNIQQLCFASPLYGVYQNPDNGRELPQRLPLLAFDTHRLDEPLRLETI